MLWIRRNLFLVIFGVIALGLLGLSVMYFLGKRGLNTQLETDLQATKSQLDGLYSKVPFPSPTNIAFAKGELVRLRQNINAAKQYFTPVPFEKVADKDFTVLLQNTIFDLQKRAQQVGIELPERDYAFSFKAQKSALTFAPGSFPTLPMQLAEIKAITDVVYDSKINRVANIKRMRVTTDDPAGSTDYHEFVIFTNHLTGTVSSPYEFTLYCFSGELGKLMEGLYKAPYGFIVKSVAIEPAPEAPVAPGAIQRLPVPAQPVPQPQPKPVGPGKPGAKPEALKTIIIEKLLKATLLIEVVKPVK